MEIAALLALGGAGYLLAQKTQPQTIARQGLPVKKEGFANAAAAPPRQQASMGLVKEAFGTSVTAPGSQLDLMYNTLMGTAPPPAEVYPQRESTIPGFKKPPTAPPSGDFQPSMEGITSATPQVAMNAGGIEEDPLYVEGDYIFSPLSGVKMSTKDFVHNNMQPYYGSRVRQNVDVKANASQLDYMQGKGDTWNRKQEVETMFDTGKTPYGNVYGLESSTSFLESRINDPRNRAGERPFEPVRVGPGVGEKFGVTGKGGFQQLEVNDVMMKQIRRTDDLRTADNPKLTYKMPVVPGQHYIGSAADQDTIGEVRKYRPDRFYIDEQGERFGPSTGEVTKETARSIQILKATTRPETSTEYSGPAQSQDYNSSYVVGSYRSPMAQQYGGAGFRNADMTGYTTADTDAPENDYGRSGWEARPNERDQTRERVMGLNLAPAEAGAVTVHYDDPRRPTRRAETVGNIRQAGVATGYAGGAPAVTVWDPKDIARTTVRETTIRQDRFGIAAPADGPTKLMVYDPDDVARPTQKAQLSAKSEYFGGGVAAHKRSMNHTFAYNMRLNPNKQKIAKGRTPVAGNGGIGIFTGDVKQTTRKLDTDVVNDRALAQNYVPNVPVGAGDIGSVQYRNPLKLDVSMERFNQDSISAVENNPLNISLRKNAERDQNVLDYMIRDRGGKEPMYAPMPA